MGQLTLFQDPPKSQLSPAQTWRHTLWRDASDKAQSLLSSGEWRDIRILHDPEGTDYIVSAVRKED